MFYDLLEMGSLSKVSLDFTFCLNEKGNQENDQVDKDIEDDESHKWPANLKSPVDINNPFSEAE